MRLLFFYSPGKTRKKKGMISMKTTKMLLSVLLVLTMVFSLAACGGASEPAATDAAPSTAPEASAITENAVYRTLYSSELTTLNYLITGQLNELSISANLVDCLVEYDSYGHLLPSLAESWESNDDASVWTFHIRPGVNWVDKDGNVVAPVTANDFVTSIRYVCDANNVSATQYAVSRIAGADDYYNWTAYQMALPSATEGTDEEGNPVLLYQNEDGEEVVLEEVPEAKLEDIGVKALDDATLEFTLTGPCPYFLSTLSFGPFMPVNAEFLEKCGDKFGTSNDTLLYCGAFTLSTYEPQQKRVLTKNPQYWDKDKVYIDEIRMTYNAEASSISATMYQSGEIDQATIPSNLLSAMMADPATAAKIHPTRSDTSYAYWYLFNFDPNFDAEYEPENWRLAVNNENFRQSIVAGMNRMPALAANDRVDPESMKINTITPSGFTAASKDYVYYGDLAKYTEGDNYDEEKALAYKEKAMEELTAEGATFPVKMLMTYNPTVANWSEECQIVEQNLEKLLGSDYIDVIVQAGPETGFLTLRRTGEYAFMKCNWGADYADPQTWTDPFVEDSSYSFIYKSDDPETKAIFQEYMDLVNAAKAINTDMEARYEAFAKAEALLLDHAFALPIHISSRSYQMCNLNVFEGQYASFGLASQRYKGQHLYDTSMGLNEYQTAYAEWLKELSK